MKTRKASFGFIVLRHVNSEESNEFWKNSYHCIRKYYSNLIVIIDDNSNEYLTPMPMKNVIVINSEYPGRGELLPYYYYSKHKWFNQAVILHDSAFINKKIDFHVNSYNFLWEFTMHRADKPHMERPLIKALKNNEGLSELYESGQWKGCFGVMMVVNHSLLKEIDKQYDLSRLLPLIKNREDRMALERVIACLFQTKGAAVSMFGDIFKYGDRPFFYKYKNYLRRKPLLPIVKVWVGR